VKLLDFRESYYTHSGKASDVARQLGFAGLGVVWIFKYEEAGNQSVPEGLVPVAALIVLALSCDFLQYIAATLIWGIFTRVKEKEGVNDLDEISAPPLLNWPALLFFWTKITLTISAYVVLIEYLFTALVD